LLKRNKTKNSHAGEIGEGESNVRLLSGVKNESVQNYSVQCKGYNLIGVTTVERGNGSYDSTGLFRITYAFIGSMYRYTDWCTVPACTQVHLEANKTSLHNLVIDTD
jgi:hypothetical protein